MAMKVAHVGASEEVFSDARVEGLVSLEAIT